jgi:glycosyltransferase involved in cell wall biosynthesis
LVNNYCGRFGGVEQNIADVARGLRERGHHCTLVYRTEVDQGAAYRAYFDAAVASDCGAELTQYLQSQAGGAGVDVVYVHKLASVTPLLSLKGRVRLVRMFHDHDECCPRRHKYLTFSSRICKGPVGWRCWADLAFVERDRGRRIGFRLRSLFAHKRELEMNRRVFDDVLVASSFMRDELAMNGFSSHRIHCLAPCVRLPERPVAPAPDNNELLFVGQLIKGKGVDLLLDAVARLRKPWHLTVAGDGNARAALERRAHQLGIAAAVTFAGWIPREALDALYDNCRILAVPSRWAEPFGMIGLEAMHRARPVVGFAVGGIPEWLEDGVNGYAVPERDTQLFADALEALLDDIGLTRAMGERGRNKLEYAFDYSRYLDNLVAVLQGKIWGAQ